MKTELIAIGCGLVLGGIGSAFAAPSCSYPLEGKTAYVCTPGQSDCAGLTPTDCSSTSGPIPPNATVSSACVDNGKGSGWCVLNVYSKANPVGKSVVCYCTP